MGGGGNTLPPAGNGLTFEVFNFSSEFLHEMDFGADFSFGGDSFLPEIEVDFFKNTSLLGEDLFTYDDVSISHLVESIVSTITTLVSGVCPGADNQGPLLITTNSTHKLPNLRRTLV